MKINANPRKETYIRVNSDIFNDTERKKVSVGSQKKKMEECKEFMIEMVRKYYNSDTVKNTRAEANYKIFHRNF